MILWTAISILGFEHHQTDHDRDQTDGCDDKSKDDCRRRVTQLLRWTILEILDVYIQKQLLHHRVGPRDGQAVRNLLSANAEVTVQTTHATPVAPVCAVHFMVELC